MANAGKIVIGIILCIVLPGILQCVGFIKNEWAASPNATCPIVKLKDNKCGEDYETVYVLEVIPTLVFILPIAAVVSSICGCEKCGDDDDDGAGVLLCALLACSLWISSIFCVLAYPFVGILIITGCIMFSTHFPTSDLGPSFSLCVSAGCVHTLGMMYTICNKFRKSDGRIVEERTVNVPPQEAIQTVSGGVVYMEETTTAVHDSETGTTIFSRDFKFIRIFE